ncbi:MAG: LDL receptor domain-containing protein [Polyangiales bacterium]
MNTRAYLLGVLLCLGCGDEEPRGRSAAGGDETARVDGGRFDAGRGDDGGVDGGVRVSDGPDARDAATPPREGDAGVPGAMTADDRALEELVLSKLIECTLLPTSFDVPANAQVRDETDRCLARCNVAAECDDIRRFACDATTTRSAFTTCLTGCTQAPADGFACGDGTRVAHVLVCNGKPNCPDGTDEDDCAHACGDGSAIEDGLGIACDGNEDCADGSDEAGCLLCDG